MQYDHCGQEERTMNTFIPRHIAKATAESMFRFRWELQNRPKAVNTVRRIQLGVEELECIGFEMLNWTKVTRFTGGESTLSTFYRRVEDLGNAYYMERITSVQYRDGVLEAAYKLLAFTDHPPVKGN